MKVESYIKEYSPIYKTIINNPAQLHELVEGKYFYIPNPSRGEMESQIELHMFWRIPLPKTLVKKLEYWIEQGVFFYVNVRVYHYVNRKYLPLVQCYTNITGKSRELDFIDFSYSMELYKKAPWHYNLTEDTYNSLECLKHVRLHPLFRRVVNIKCFDYLRSMGEFKYLSVKVVAMAGDLEALKYMHQRGARLCDPIDPLKANQVKCLAYICEYSKSTTQTGLHKVHIHDSLIVYAAIGNCIDCLKYLFENKSLGLPVKNAIMYAAKAGYIDIVKYLHVRGVPYTPDMWKDVTNAECVHYMRATGWAELGLRSQFEGYNKNHLTS